ncbi:MAG: Uma2 family endonuclease [Spirosomataceae bacterium]
MEKVANVMELLLERPDAFKVIEEAQRQLQEEQARRTQFYDNLDESVKAEFINGELVVHSPVRSRHAAVSDNVFSLIRTFAMKHKLGRATHEKVMSRFTRNDYEPDVMFFKNEKAATITPMQALFPVPDLVVEIVSNATENRDRGVKFKDYAAHGVEEYWIVDAETQIIEQYQLEKEIIPSSKKQTKELSMRLFCLI